MEGGYELTGRRDAANRVIPSGTEGVSRWPATLRESPLNFAERSRQSGLFVLDNARRPLDGVPEDCESSLFFIMRTFTDVTAREVTVTGGGSGGLVTLAAPEASRLCGLSATLGKIPKRREGARVVRLAKPGAARVENELDGVAPVRYPIEPGTFDAAFIQGENG